MATIPDEFEEAQRLLRERRKKQGDDPANVVEDKAPVLAEVDDDGKVTYERKPDAVFGPCL